ncbi:MAG: carboxypeptidase regulatory-like domain-containing protein [Pyrinomonadaceae bacterium]
MKNSMVLAVQGFFLMFTLAAGLTVLPFSGGRNVASDGLFAVNSFSASWENVFSKSKLHRVGSGISAETPANVKMTIRDSVTGKRISARVIVANENALAAEIWTDTAGRGNYRLPKGRNDFEIAAAGYFAMLTYFEIGDSPIDITFWLDPQLFPKEMTAEAIQSKQRDGQTFIHGHVIDDESGKASANARVYIANAGIETLTDQNGYFRMYVPTPPVNPVGDLPGTDDLVVESRGEIVYRRTNILLPEGAVHFIVDIKGGGPITIDGTHKLKLSPDELKNTQTTPESTKPPIAFESAQPDAVTVPANIRVGSNCPTRSTCSTFQTYSLDTYVRLGLDDEWIASWNANSLKAGAIAFRSYAVYHIYHPLTANYDICNTTSCQVMDPTDSHVNTDNATAQTTGSIVVDSTRNNSFFAEYSAENNNGGCTDGFTGNNVLWPCLSDPVDTGQTFFGHGRGMCQWGSQRWSINQGKDFVWIVNHYYNASGNPSLNRSGFLQLSPNTALPPPTLAAPGVATAPGTTVSSATPTFTWEPVSGSDGYSLYVSKFNGSTYDVVFNSETVVGQPITGTAYTLPAGILQSNNQYRWNMSSHNLAGYGTPNFFRNYFSVSLSASISGRVTTPDGLGLRNAIVTLTDSQGVRQVATTSSFGYYTFNSVRPGETYVAGVSSKRYRFAARNLTVSDNLANIDFVGLE